MTNNISFEEALSCSQELIKAIHSGELKESALISAISTLIATENGARGFFVTYLTDDVYGTADRVTGEVIEALKTSPAIVNDLLVKNLAMSTAMELTHRRKDDPDSAAGSQRVQARTFNIITLLASDDIMARLRDLAAFLGDKGGVYGDFLRRWGYDEEQRSAIGAKVKTLVEKVR